MPKSPNAIVSNVVKPNAFWLNESGPSPKKPNAKSANTKRTIHKRVNYKLTTYWGSAAFFAPTHSWEKTKASDLAGFFYDYFIPMLQSFCDLTLTLPSALKLLQSSPNHVFLC